jgi:hypothetical protein
VGLQRFDVFLGFKLFLEGWCGCGGAARLPDLSVEFLNLALQPNFQVLGPAIEFIGFRFEEERVPLGDRLQNRFLVTHGDGRQWFARRRGIHCVPATRRKPEQTTGLFHIQRLAIIGQRRNDEIVLNLVKRLNRE